jgi:hypothetical protein
MVALGSPCCIDGEPLAAATADVLIRPLLIESALQIPPARHALMPLKLSRVAGLALPPAGIRVIAKTNLNWAGNWLAIEGQ